MLKLIPMFFVTIFFIYGCSKNDKKETNLPIDVQKQLQSVKVFNDLFEKYGEVEFKSPDSLGLSSPTSILIKKSGEIIWAQYNPPIYIFNANGVNIKKVGTLGRGPGEFNSVADIGLDSIGRLYIFDSAQLRVTILSESYEYLYSYQLQRGGFKKMCIDNIGNFYALHEGAYGILKPAIKKYTYDGKVASEWGKIPQTAILQDILLGGGVTQDSKNIYYCYIADHRIWKTNHNGEEEVVFNDKPSYFREAQNEHVSNKDVGALVKYSWKISRVIGIHYLSIGIIIQQINNGNPKEGEKVKSLLEVWDVNGNKWCSAIECPGEIITAFDNKIGILKETEQQTTDSKPVLVFYKLK